MGRATIGAPPHHSVHRVLLRGHMPVGGRRLLAELSQQEFAGAVHNVVGRWYYVPVPGCLLLQKLQQSCGISNGRGVGAFTRHRQRPLRKLAGTIPFMKAACTLRDVVERAGGHLRIGSGERQDPGSCTFVPDVITYRGTATGEAREYENLLARISGPGQNHLEHRKSAGIEPQPAPQERDVVSREGESGVSGRVQLDGFTCGLQGSGPVLLIDCCYEQVVVRCGRERLPPLPERSARRFPEVSFGVLEVPLLDCEVSQAEVGIRTSDVVVRGRPSRAERQYHIAARWLSPMRRESRPAVNARIGSSGWRRAASSANWSAVSFSDRASAHSVTCADASPSASARASSGRACAVQRVCTGSRSSGASNKENAKASCALGSTGWNRPLRSAELDPPHN